MSHEEEEEEEEENTSSSPTLARLRCTFPTPGHPERTAIGSLVQLCDD